jgi:rhodanese-related sulfurtransferase
LTSIVLDLPKEPVRAMNDVHQLFEHRADYQILDVRERDEWDAGHIEGAVHLPLAQVMRGDEKGHVDPDRPVVAVCRVGNRSELATLMLQARGYEAVNLEGGMEAWAAAGLPFSSSDGAPGRVA